MRRLVVDSTFEPHFLKSVLVFGSNLRVTASLAMREAFVKEETTGEDRRLLYLSIRQQVCMAMEDVGAYLYAFQEKQQGNDFIDALTRYKSHEVYLFNLFAEKTDTEIADAFGFGEIPTILQEQGYTEEQNAEAASQFVTHFKTLAGSQENMLKGCNKLKHGGLAYLPESQNELRVLIREDGEPKPLGIHYNASELSKYVFVTVMCSIQIKELVFRYLAIYHPPVAEQAWRDESVEKDYIRVTEMLEILRAES